MAVESIHDRKLRAAASVLIERLQFARQAGVTFNGMRDLYEILGYERAISTAQYRERYARGGIAGRIVDVFPKATWRGEMELVEDQDPENDTEFEKAWNALNTRLKITSVLQRGDVLSQLGYYSVLLIGAPGKFSDELPKGKPEDLLYLTPFSGGGGPGIQTRFTGSRGDGNLNVAFGDATIQSFDINVESPRFGLPETYQLRRTDVSSPELQVPVHWSRIIHIAEGCLDNEVYGSPRLERVYNLLDDLDKVTGGGAEAFWLRANQGLQLDVDKDMTLSADEKTALQTQADEYQHQIRRMLRTRGVTVNPLGSDVANFSNPADAILTQIAGSLAIPKRILTGSEMGELASSQDRDNWKDQVNGRQTGYAGPYIVRPLVDRLIKYNYLPTPVKGVESYEVRWPHIQTLTEQEKADGAAKWASINSSSNAIVFTEDEIRDKWYQLGPVEGQEDIQPWRAVLAEKMATTNKTQGAVIFTDDEIRKTCYDWAPLTPEQKVPITAPERVSATAPTPAVDAQGKPTPAKPTPAPIALEHRELLDGPHKFASTQVQLPDALSGPLTRFGSMIPRDDLAEDGLEPNAHITVKYGIHSDSPDEIARLLDNTGPVRFELGTLNIFEADDFDVLYAEVYSPDLERLNALISTRVAVTDTQPTYTPHATIAYLKSGRGAKYVGNATVAGLSATVEDVAFFSKDHVRTYIPTNRDGELLAVLEAAILVGNTEVVHKIIGLGDTPGHDFHGNQWTEGKAMADLHAIAIGDAGAYTGSSVDRKALVGVLQKMTVAQVERAARGQANAVARGQEDDEKKQPAVAKGVYNDIMLAYHGVMRGLGDAEGHPFHGNQWQPGDPGVSTVTFDPKLIQGMVRERLSPQAVSKLHDALATIDDYMHDPDISGPLWSMLSSFTPETLRTRIEAMETNRHGLFGYHPKEAAPYYTPEGGRAKINYRANATSDDALDHILGLVLDRPLLEDLLNQAIAVGDWNVFTKQLRAPAVGWEVTDAGLVKTFEFTDRRECAAFIARLMQDSNISNHHPDVASIPNGVTVTFVTHSANNTITELDHQATQRADQIASSFRTAEEKGHEFHGNQYDSAGQRAINALPKAVRADIKNTSIRTFTNVDEASAAIDAYLLKNYGFTAHEQARALADRERGKIFSLADTHSVHEQIAHTMTDKISSSEWQAATKGLNAEDEFVKAFVAIGQLSNPISFALEQTAPMMVNAFKKWGWM